MRRHGLEDEALSVACAEDVAEASALAGRLLARPDAPTAFACGSDTYGVAAAYATILFGYVAVVAYAFVKLLGADILGQMREQRAAMPKREKKSVPVRREVTA